METAIIQRPFTVEEYLKMAESGLFHPEERIELIDGKIMLMLSAGSPHIMCVNRLTRLCILQVDAEAIVSVQNTFRLADHSAPEPDLALLRRPDTRYADRLAEPEDVFLLIEVSHSTLRYDRQTKAPLYAKAGIQEFWLVDVKDRTIKVYTQPSATGYQQETVYGTGQTLQARALPALQIPLAELFA